MLYGASACMCKQHGRVLLGHELLKLAWYTSWLLAGFWLAFWLAFGWLFGWLLAGFWLGSSWLLKDKVRLASGWLLAAFWRLLAGFDFEQTLEGVNHAFEPRCVGPRRMFCHLLGICAPALALRLLLQSSLFLFLHPLLVCKVQPTHLVGLLALGVVQPFLVCEPAVPDSNVGPPTSRAGLAAKPYRRGHGLKMRIEAAV